MSSRAQCRRLLVRLMPDNTAKRQKSSAAAADHCAECSCAEDGSSSELAAPDLPATMKAVVWRGDPDPSKMVIETIKTPRPKADEVLVKVKACGVCHTDLHCILGEVPFPKPAVFGHEICGEVVAFGPSDRAPPFPIGTKVMSPFIMPCSRCWRPCFLAPSCTRLPAALHH